MFNNNSLILNLLKSLSHLYLRTCNILMHGMPEIQQKKVNPLDSGKRCLSLCLNKWTVRTIFFLSLKQTHCTKPIEMYSHLPSWGHLNSRIWNSSKNRITRSNPQTVAWSTIWLPTASAHPDTCYRDARSLWFSCKFGRTLCSGSKKKNLRKKK